MMNTHKRANKRQKERLIDKLYTNIEMARGNQSERDVIEFWTSLTQELNELGCSRTVQQWQHIWSVMAAKAKTKYRKIRVLSNTTGAGPVEIELSQDEQKILYVVGSASVQGFTSMEVGLPIVEQTEDLTDLTSSPNLGPSFDSQDPLLPNNEQPREAEVRPPSLSIRSRRRQRRRQLPMNDNLISALHENNAILRDSIIQAAEILAAAIRSAGIAILMPESQREEPN